jgi:hypothetical protein
MPAPTPWLLRCRVSTPRRALPPYRRHAKAPETNHFVRQNDSCSGANGLFPSGTHTSRLVLLALPCYRCSVSSHSLCVGRTFCAFACPSGSSALLDQARTRHDTNADADHQSCRSRDMASSWGLLDQHGTEPDRYQPVSHGLFESSWLALVFVSCPAS